MRAFRLIMLVSLVLLPTLAKTSADSRVCKSPLTKSALSNQNTAAERLSWVPGKNICGGSYYNPPLPDEDKPLVALGQHPIDLSFVDASVHQEGRSSFTEAVVTQPQRILSSDVAYLNKDKANSKFESVDLHGHVVVREPGKMIVGDSAHMSLQAHTGNFLNALYRLSLDPALSARPSVLMGPPVDPKRSLTAQGKAKIVEQKARGLIEMDQATYSTCSPTDVTWQLRAKHVTLNREVGRGVARHATLYVKNVPVFYTPYFSFPIDKRRKSGILFPTYGNSKLGGFMLQVPYYWNIAPDYDATITPGWYSARGAQITTEFRYLTPKNHGELTLSVLPHDNAFVAFRTKSLRDFATSGRAYELNRLADTHDSRGYFAWRNRTHFSPRWSSHIDYMRVSDDYFFRDITILRAPLVPNQLLQQGDIRYSGDVWQFRGLLQNYQTLHPVNLTAISNPYAKLPQLSLSATYPNQKFGLTYQLQNEYTHFTQRMNPGALVPPPGGDRLHVQPGISLPINGISGYITPNLQLYLTGYKLQNQITPFASQISRGLPVASLDSGLFFDKEITLGSRDYQQTLEPRLFYLYVPYADQSQIPLFDTGFPGFTYDMLFRTNRFNGLDRIGDANQVALALTTRFLDQETGQEKFRASIGQLYYFQDRRIRACFPPNDPNACPTTFEPETKTRTSPIAGLLSYSINPLWTTTANVAWDPNIQRTRNGALNFQYRPAKNTLLNLGYNFLYLGDPRINAVTTAIIPTNLSQTIISGAWPIKDRWQVVGSWNYNISHDRSQTYFYGVEYNNCCWAARLVMGRTFSGLAPNSQQPLYNSAVYFQIQLKGFGNFGATNPMNVLGSIPGFRDQFGQL